MNVPGILMNSPCWVPCVPSRHTDGPVDQWAEFEDVAVSHVRVGGVVMFIRPLYQPVFHDTRISSLLSRFPDKGWTQISDVQFSLLPSWGIFASMVSKSTSFLNAWAYLDAVVAMMHWAHVQDPISTCQPEPACATRLPPPRAMGNRTSSLPSRADVGGGTRASPCKVRFSLSGLVPRLLILRWLWPVEILGTSMELHRADRLTELTAMLFHKLSN